MATNACSQVQIKYQGTGRQKLFTFPFTYLNPDDISVSIWDETTKDYVTLQRDKWSFANATTVELVDPPQVPTDTKVFNVWIYRETDISSMDAVFFPGSAIRAEDLNDDFDQLRLAIEEGRCKIPESVLKLLTDEYWNKTTDTIDTEEFKKGQWVNDDKHIATIGAISERLDPYVQETKPVDPPITDTRQPGKIWFDNNELQFSYWEPSANAWVNLALAGPSGPPGPQATGGLVAGNGVTADAANQISSIDQGTI